MPREAKHRKGLQEFLAACGARGTSANTQSQDGVIAEGGAEGRRRVVFDLENISKHSTSNIIRRSQSPTNATLRLTKKSLTSIGCGCALPPLRIELPKIAFSSWRKFKNSSVGF